MVTDHITYGAINRTNISIIFFPASSIDLKQHQKFKGCNFYGTRTGQNLITTWCRPVITTWCRPVITTWCRPVITTWCRPVITHPSCSSIKHCFNRLTPRDAYLRQICAYRNQRILPDPLKHDTN